MNENKEMPIKFRIQLIETLQFAILNEAVVEDKLSYATNYGFGIDHEGMIVRSMFHYELLSETQISLLIEIAIDFNIESECFQKFFQRDGKFYIPRGFATHIATIVVGTARGILHEKTKDTQLSRFPIPTINVQNQITDDIQFEE